MGCLLPISLLIFFCISCPSTPCTVQASSSQSNGSFFFLTEIELLNAVWKLTEPPTNCISVALPCSYCTNSCKCWNSITFPFLNAGSQEAAWFVLILSAAMIWLKWGALWQRDFDNPDFNDMKTASRLSYEAVTFLRQKSFSLYDSKHFYSLFTFYIASLCFSRFSGSASGKEPTCQCRRYKRHGFDPWVVKLPWRKK